MVEPTAAMVEAPAFIETHGHFVHEMHRGFRVPNHYSAADKSQLRNLGARQPIRVYNARLLNPPPTLREHGFQLLRAPTEVDLLDNEAVKEHFYRECRVAIKTITGCSRVWGGSSHAYRNGFAGLPRGDPRAARPTPNGSGGNYGEGIHSDMCAYIEDELGNSLGGSHFECLNLWRSTDRHRNIAMMPLALCDMRTVSPRDIVFGDGMNTSNAQQYTKTVDQKIVYSPSQRWYYFPDMAPDEMLIFRQYDTRQEALNLRTVFHSAVVDPSSPPDAAMRSTIEVRMQAIHGPDPDHEARLARFKAQISGRYADGRPSSWFSGPVEGYRPPPSSRL